MLRRRPTSRPRVVDVAHPPARPKPVIRFPAPYDPDNPVVPDWAEKTAAREVDEPTGAHDPGQDAAGKENQDYGGDEPARNKRRDDGR